MLTLKTEDSVQLFGKDHEYTKLIISHNNVDPEDVYSQVAYEKGFHFVWYLERLVGRKYFDQFIPHYFGKWAEKSLDSFEFRDTYMSFFEDFAAKLEDSSAQAELREKIASIDWNDRLYSPGLPPKPDFDTSLAIQCYDLAKKWKENVRYNKHSFAFLSLLHLTDDA